MKHRAITTRLLGPLYQRIKHFRKRTPFLSTVYVQNTHRSYLLYNVYVQNTDEFSEHSLKIRYHILLSIRHVYTCITNYVMVFMVYSITIYLYTYFLVSLKIIILLFFSSKHLQKEPASLKKDEEEKKSDFSLKWQYHEIFPIYIRKCF